MKKDLLCAEMISRNTAGPGREPVSEEAVTDYYNKNSDRFVRESDAVKYIEIITDDLSSAASIHRQITRDNFQDMAVKYSKAPIQDSRAVPYLPLSALPKKLADAISLLKPGQASEPVEIDGDFRVVMIIDKQPAGTLCSFDEVREEIIGTLSTQIQKLSFDDMLSGLRLKTDYELHVDRIPVSETDH
jgi:parvulin-like peptidyl-prolyl isomerase